MKKIKKSKRENIQNILHSIEKISDPTGTTQSEAPKFQDIFSHQWKILCDYYHESRYFSILKPPEKPEKYQFLSSKFTKTNRDQICDQLNFIEGNLKDAYFPRDLLIDNLNENAKQVKNYGNRLLTFPYMTSEKNNKFILIFTNRNKNALNVVDLDFFSNNDNNFELTVKKTIQTPEISIPEIFQINKQLINNKNFINLRTNNYVVSFPFSENFIDSPVDIEQLIKEMENEIFVYKGFDAKLIDMKVSNFFSEQNYILTAGNSIYLLEDGKSSILLNSDKNKFGVNTFYFLENSHHPKNLYLMSTEKIYNFDQRTSKPQETISKDNDLQRFFGIKHYNQQFILLSTSKTFSFYDIRYPKNPVLEFRHFLEENPPSILDFSAKISDFSRNVSSFESDLHNMEFLEKYSKNCETPKKLLLSFSPNKSGSVIANIFDQDLFEVGNNKDLVKMLEISKEPSFSFKKFQNPMVPLLLYSNNMKFDKYKIAGVSCQSVLNDLNLVFQSDNLGGLSLQILKDENNKLNHLTLNFNQQEGVDDLIDLEELKINRLFEKNQEKKSRIQLKFEGEDDFDDFSISEEFDDLAQQFEERSLKFRNLDKIFKKLLRETQKKKDLKNNTNNYGKKLEFPEERTQDTVNTKIAASQMNLEDMIFGLTTEELTKERKKITNFFNENFLMTEELEEHLKTKWDEEK